MGGDAVVLRSQRVVFQQWKKDVPWAKQGEVTVALGGDIAKEAGVLPDPNALQPTSAPAAAAPPPAPSPAASTPAVLPFPYSATFDDAQCEFATDEFRDGTDGCTGGEYRMTITRPNAIGWSVHDIGAPPDFDIGADVRFVGQSRAEAGIMFNVGRQAGGGGPVSGYRFALLSSGQYFLTTVARILQAQTIGTGNILVRGTAPGFRAREGARLKATRTGATIALYINGQKVASLDDVSQPSRQVGLFVASFDPATDVDVRFDNFGVGPPNTVPDVHYSAPV